MFNWIQRISSSIRCCSKGHRLLTKTLFLTRTLLHTFKNACQKGVILRESVLSNFFLPATRFLVEISILHIQSYMHTRFQNRIKFLTIHHCSVQQDRDGPKLDWTRDHLMYDRYRDWKQRVKILFATAFEAESEKSKCNYIKYWLGEKGLPLIRK